MLTANPLQSSEEEFRFLEAARPSGLKSGLFNFLAMAVPLAIYILVTPFLISRLGTARYGLLALFFAIPTALVSVDFGLVTGGIFSIGRMIKTRQMSKVLQLHGELVSLFMLLGFALCAATWLAAPRLVGWLRLSAALDAGRAAVLIRIAAACLLVSLLTEAACIIPRALEQFPRLALIQVASKVALWLGVAGLALSGIGLGGIALWTLCVGLLTLVAYLEWTRRSLWPSISWRPAVRIQEAAVVFSYSFFAFVSQLTSAVSYHADKFIVAHFLGPVSVSYYAISTGIALKILAVGGVVTSFVFPRAVALHASLDSSALRALYLRASRCNLLVLVPALLPAVMLAPSLLRVWLGQELARQASFPLQLLLVAYFITALSVVPSYIYSGIGNSRIGALYASAGAVLNVLFCVLLTPSLGIKGAALADLIGALQSILFMGSLENRLGLGWFKSQGELFGRIFFVGALQAAVLTLIGAWAKGWFSLLAVGLMAWLLFYAAWFLMPSLSTQEDRALLTRIAGFCFS